MKFGHGFFTLCLWLGVTVFGAAWAHSYKLGMLEIGSPYVRAMPASAQVSSGYLKITNKGEEADRLIEVRSDQAARIEIHEMRIEEGVMRMRPLSDGLELPVGETVTLEPGGYHLMIFEPKEPLIAGERFQAELHFAKAGIVEVTFNIEDISAQSGQADESAHHDTH